MKKLFTFFVFLFIAVSSFSQTRETDSLYNKLKTSRRDTNRVNLFNDLSDQLNSLNPTISLKYAQKARLLAELINYKKGEIKSYCNIGLVYYRQGDYPNALKNYLFAEKLLNQYPNNTILSNVYNNIALVYVELDKFSLAKSFFNKSIKLDNESNNFQGLADSYNNLGSIYAIKNEIRNAKTYFELSLKFRIKSNDTKNLPYTLLNLGDLNILNKNFSTATRQISQALVICEKNDDIIGVSLVYNVIGDLKTAQHEYNEAISYYKKSLELSIQYKIKSHIQHSYEALSTIYQKLGKYKESTYYLKETSKIKDQIFNKENAKNLIEMETKYETEKRKRELLKKSSELDKKNFQINVFRIGFGIILLLVFFIIFNLREKSKINKIILKQKQSVEFQNRIIEEKNKLVETQNKDITDSIKYAERIQHAILPPKNVWERILPNSFVIYQPKDILSGDFHWIAETETHIFVAAADCTGHGVPGALISLVNYNLLNKAVLEKGIEDTGKILDAVNDWLTESLHQKIENSTVKDGMDISLISIHKITNEICFSGAFNSIYVITENELVVYKGNKFPVGSFLDEEINHFTSIKIDVKKGDSIYLFTDGYPDQFGGDKEKKYKHKQLKENLLKIHSKELMNQKEILTSNFNNWKGDLEQLDDVLMIGIKV